jgi:hypothetical protein
MSKTETVRELESAKRRFELYGRTCAQMADEARAGGRKRADLNARAEVWQGAALDLENAIASVKARRPTAKRKAAKVAR